jgi:hypothetical protein
MSRTEAEEFFSELNGDTKTAPHHEDGKPKQDTRPPAPAVSQEVPLAVASL